MRGCPLTWAFFSKCPASLAPRALPEQDVQQYAMKLLTLIFDTTCPWNPTSPWRLYWRKNANSSSGWHNANKGNSSEISIANWLYSLVSVCASTCSFGTTYRNFLVLEFNFVLVIPAVIPLILVVNKLLYFTRSFDYLLLTFAKFFIPPGSRGILLGARVQSRFNSPALHPEEKSLWKCLKAWAIYQNNLAARWTLSICFHGKSV